MSVLATPLGAGEHLVTSSQMQPAHLEQFDDVDLSDLAARSQTLTRDPAAGGTSTRVAVGVLVVLAVAYLTLFVAAGCVGNSQCLT